MSEENTENIEENIDKKDIVKTYALKLSEYRLRVELLITLLNDISQIEKEIEALESFLEDEGEKV